MYQVYILQSLKIERLYIGFTDNIEQRLAAHNRGDVRSTKAYRPYRVLRVEQYESKTDARKRELQLKRSGRLRKELKQLVASEEKWPLMASSSNG